MKRHARVEDLSTYLDDELAAAERQRLEGHLQQCPRCREQLQGMRRVVEGLEAMSKVAPLPYLEQEVRRSVLQRPRLDGPLTRAERGISRWMLRPSWVPAFATVMALVLIIYLFSWGLYRQQQRGIPVVLESESNETGVPESGVGATLLDAEGGERGPRAASVPERPGRERELSTEDSSGLSEAYREVAGRAFSFRDGHWIEAGLEEASPNERFDAATEGARPWMDRYPELQQIGELGGTVRLRLGDQIVEVTFP